MLGQYIRTCLRRSSGRFVTPALGCRPLTSAIPKELFRQPPALITRLPNGLRVASQHTPDETITVGVFVDSGSRFETRATNGVAHFLEHLIFKGTKRRSRTQLEKEIEDIGGHLNAYTAREQTVDRLNTLFDGNVSVLLRYYAKTFKQDLPLAMDILSDILTNSILSPGAIEEERYVILREMEEVAKSLEEVIFDRLHMAAFPDSPLGFTILGPPQNIQSIQRSWLLDYIQRNYTADRIVIAGAGDFRHDELARLTMKYFSKIPSQAKTGAPGCSETPRFHPGQLLQEDRGLPLTHCAIGYEGVCWNDPYQPVFMLLQQLLGTYDHTQPGIVPACFSENRFLQDLACAAVHSFSGFNTCYKDTGLFGIYFTCPGWATPRVLHTFESHMRMMALAISASELTMAKRLLKASLFGSLDTTTAICEDLGRQVLVYGRRLPAAELYQRIDSVTPELVRQVVWDKLFNKPASIAAIGAVDGIETFQALRSS